MLRAGTVYLVGAGPGDPGLITRRGLQVLQQADTVVHDRLANPELLMEARPDARLIYAGKASSDHTLSQSEINRLLVAEAQQGWSVCRLKGGDPFLFGRGGEEAAYLVEHGVPFEVVPGVSSALAVPAYAGIPVTDRRFASTLAIATGHDGAKKETPPIDWPALARQADTLVVLMGVKMLAEITAGLLAGGHAPDLPAALIRWGTTGMQQTLVSDLAHIAAEAVAADFGPPAVLVVGNVVRLAPGLAWFEQRPLHGLRVLVTRPRHQASALADLLREHGAEPVVCSVIAVEPVDPQPAALRRLAKTSWDWVLFTSANTVEHLAGHLRSAGLDWRALAGARLAAMGPGTAGALERYGLRVDFVPSRAVGEAAGAELPHVGPGAKVLLPRAAEAPDTVPRLLGERGATVEILPTYRTVPDEQGIALCQEALASGEVDVITFTSSSGVTALVSAVGAELVGRHTIACIGPVTAETARRQGLEVAIEAPQHTIPGLVAALTEHAARRLAERSNP